MQENKWKKEMPEVPENVHNAVLSALNMISENSIGEKGSIDMKKNKETFKNQTAKRFIRSMAAVAACAALLVTATTFHRQFSGNNQDGNQVSEKSSPLTNLTEVLPDFSITSYAAELDIVEASGVNIIFADSGIGADGYTGMLFRIEGDDISDVKISLDKGELYSATIENTTEDALSNRLAQGLPDEDRNPDTYTITKLISQDLEGENVPSQNVRLYHCTKKGREISESYNKEMYYGFYIPDSVFSSIGEEEDLAAAYHNLLEIFEGSELKVTVTYKDGTTSEKGYTLSVEKLAQDENGVITQEVWTGDNEGAFVYGIIAQVK